MGKPAAAAAVPQGGADAGPANVCLLCRRKLPSPEALLRHEHHSELHRRNLGKQDELVQQHKQDILSAVSNVRQQLHEAARTDPGQRGALEQQLRQLLGELGMAQEMLEHTRALRGGKSGVSGGAGRPQPSWREARVGGLALDIGVACWQGGKEVQEDRYILDLELTSSDGHTVVGFCVFDGHSGSRCVDHAVEKLPQHLQTCLSKKAYLSEELLGQAVIDACAMVDSDFLVQARQTEMNDGSTMILGLLFPEVEAPPNKRPKLLDGEAPPRPRAPGACRLLVANIGDSRAVLGRREAAAPGTPGGDKGQEGGRLVSVRLSEDHKPNRPDEQRRIQSLGGIVDHHGVWRVFVPSQVNFGGRAIPRWALAVSRAFGDLLLKEPERYGCPSVAPGGLVIAEPELQTVEVDPVRDRFLVLACDGVWDVLRDEDAVAVCAGQAGAELAAHSLVRHAFAAGSGDNLTALVVAWRPVE